MLSASQVFVQTGIPRHTYIEIPFHGKVRQFLLQPGSPVVIEGPSGIGKTTSIMQALANIPDEAKPEYLAEQRVYRARVPRDITAIDHFISRPEPGLTIIDDFHRLPWELREDLSDLVKVLADDQDPEIKVVIVGITHAHRSLIRKRADVAARISVVTADLATEEQIAKMVAKGEAALKIKFAENDIKRLAECSVGSFQMAQTLCLAACIQGGVEFSDSEEVRDIEVDIEALIEDELSRIDAEFQGHCRIFSKGPSGSASRSNRFPYYHLLEWLAEFGPWEIDIDLLTKEMPYMQRSIAMIFQKKGMSNFIKEKSISTIHENIFFDYDERKIYLEYPRFAFYLRNYGPSNLRRKFGIPQKTSEREYDVALSFAGEDNEVASKMYTSLVDLGLEVFKFDEEEITVAAESINQKVSRVYGRQSELVVPIFSVSYLKKYLTQLEESIWKPLLSEGRVMSLSVGALGHEVSRKYGSIPIDSSDLDGSVIKAAQQIAAQVRALQASTEHSPASDQ